MDIIEEKGIMYGASIKDLINQYNSNVLINKNKLNNQPNIPYSNNEKRPIDINMLNERIISGKIIFSGELLHYKTKEIIENNPIGSFTIEIYKKYTDDIFAPKIPIYRNYVKYENGKLDFEVQYSINDQSENIGDYVVLLTGPAKSKYLQHLRITSISDNGDIYIHSDVLTTEDKDDEEFNGYFRKLKDVRFFYKDDNNNKIPMHYWHYTPYNIYMRLGLNGTIIPIQDYKKQWYNREIPIIDHGFIPVTFGELILNHYNSENIKMKVNDSDFIENLDKGIIEIEVVNINSEIIEYIDIYPDKSIEKLNDEANSLNFYTNWGQYGLGLESYDLREMSRGIYTEIKTEDIDVSNINNPIIRVILWDKSFGDKDDFFKSYIGVDIDFKRNKVTNPFNFYKMVDNIDGSKKIIRESQARKIDSRTIYSETRSVSYGEIFHREYSYNKNTNYYPIIYNSVDEDLKISDFNYRERDIVFPPLIHSSKWTPKEKAVKLTYANGYRDSIYQDIDSYGPKFSDYREYKFNNNDSSGLYRFAVDHLDGYYDIKYYIPEYDNYISKMPVSRSRDFIDADGNNYNKQVYETIIIDKSLFNKELGYFEIKDRILNAKNYKKDIGIKYNKPGVWGTSSSINIGYIEDKDNPIYVETKVVDKNNQPVNNSEFIFNKSITINNGELNNETYSLGIVSVGYIHKIFNYNGYLLKDMDFIMDKGLVIVTDNPKDHERYKLYYSPNPDNPKILNLTIQDMELGKDPEVNNKTLTSDKLLKVDDYYIDRTSYIITNKI